VSSNPELVLRVVDSDGVGTVTLNRPERKNGWSPELEHAYVAALDEMDANTDVRTIVVTGAGKTFCPGMDMARLEDRAGKPLDIGGRPPLYRPRAVRKPMVAAINGACAGIGLVEALMCDVRFAARGARFSTAFARRGLGAEYGMAWVLPRYIGVENALDLLLSCRTFDADEAKALGLVSRVVEPDEVLSAAQAYARDLAVNCAPESMATIRHQVYAAMDSDFADAFYRSWRTMKYFVQRPDFVEGVAAFTEKRPPKFNPLDPDWTPGDVTGDGITPGSDLSTDDYEAREPSL
jgi:enoyl-CoA hydratase/carnithine racemase